MSHTYVSCYQHCIFSTKARRPEITADLRDRLWAYLGGIARDHKFLLIAVGGVADHVHVLLSLPATIATAKAVQLLKGGSSKWVHETFPTQAGFGWQEGYAAFSVGHASLPNVRAYLQQQEAHHQQHTFQEELVAFLQRYQIAYDERYLWD